MGGTNVAPGDAGQMLASELFFAQRTCDLKTADAIHGYVGKCSDTNYALQQGQWRPGDNWNVEDYPKVPKSWVLSTADPNDAFRFRYPEQTGPPACPAIPMWTREADPPPGFIDIGARVPFAPGWFIVGPRDRFEVGETTEVQPDGHKYQKVGAVAAKGWYIRVS